jgi:hypothetical protein
MRHHRNVSLLGRTLLMMIVVGLGLGPQGLALAAGPAGNVQIRGVIFSGETQEPVQAARVYAVHLDTKQVFTSAPSTASGEYALTGLPFGYYDMAIETTDGLYLSNRVINAPAGEKVEFSMVLGSPQPEDTEWWSAEPDRRIPGLDRVPDGVARIVEGIPKKSALMKMASGTGATTATPSPAAAASAGGGTAAARASSAGWLIPTLAAGGLLALAVAVDDDDDDQEDEGASPF